MANMRNVFQPMLAMACCREELVRDRLHRLMFSLSRRLLDRYVAFNSFSTKNRKEGKIVLTGVI